MAIRSFDYEGIDSVVSVESSRAAAFLRVSDPHGLLSNMARVEEFTVLGQRFTSSEHLYQIMRFPDRADVQSAILSESNPVLAKRVAYASDNVSAMRSDWNDVRVQAMAWALTCKLLGTGENGRFARALRATGNNSIVEISYRDAFWGARPTVSAIGQVFVGQNVLGKLLTQLRDGAREMNPPPGSRLLGRPVEALGVNASAKERDSSSSVPAAPPVAMDRDMLWQRLMGGRSMGR